VRRRSVVAPFAAMSAAPTLAVRVATALAVMALVVPARATRAGAQQQAPGPARLVAFINEPLEPQIGEVFELRLTVRLAPDVVAFFPDTLLPAADAVSAGAGAWEVTPAPADSIDVRVTYPVMGLDPGGVELPSLELWARPAGAGEEAGLRAATVLSPTELPNLQRIVIPIGGALIMPHREMIEAAELGLIPRPPADVLGAGLSVWLVAAIGVGTATVAFLVWIWLAGRTPQGVLQGVVLSPRAEALRELDRLRTLGWHANGHVVDFYDATTGVLRHFAERTDADWRTALTSTELLARLQSRWGADRVSKLGGTVWTAERVKFGTDRPAPQAAEADWLTVRGWIEELPER